MSIWQPNYYCRERLGLSDTILSQLLDELRAAIPAWCELIKRSFLSPPKKQAYAELVDERVERLTLLQ